VNCFCYIPVSGIPEPF